MNTCTIFVYSDAPAEIKTNLEFSIKDLIVNKNVSVFYFGNQGKFDFYVKEVLTELKFEFPHIKTYLVLAYLPNKKTDISLLKIDSIFPEGIETVPKQFAISWRNKWMINNSQYVITYITHSWGGAAKFKELAEKKNKNVVELSCY